ncbi:MAG TPA: hypothetical protein VKQ09_08025 [Sphingomonas sp.]|nr:hypothetical protein [Sphingomonas sp.]
MRILPLAAALTLLVPGTADGFRNTQTVEQALAGRSPGKPVTCIQQQRIDSSQIFDSGAILYRMKGGPDYLNDPHCPSLKQDRSIASRTPSISLCSGDILHVFEPVSGMDYGSCPLNEFVPYARIKKAQ